MQMLHSLPKQLDGSRQLRTDLFIAHLLEELAATSTWHCSSLHHPFLHKQARPRVPGGEAPSSFSLWWGPYIIHSCWPYN